MPGLRGIHAQTKSRVPLRTRLLCPQDEAVISWITAGRRGCGACGIEPQHARTRRLTSFLIDVRPARVNDGPRPNLPDVTPGGCVAGDRDVVARRVLDACQIQAAST